MTIPAHIFREYDIRGIAGKELTEEVALAIGKSFGTLLVREGKHVLAIGHDHRWSAGFLYQGLSKGLQSCGLTVIEIGLVPTPLVYFYVIHNKLDAGISLSGSHNPPDENGFKFHHAGRSFYGKDIQGLRELIEKNDFVTGQGKVERPDHDALVKNYQDFIFRGFKFTKKLKVIMDTGHGMAAVTAPALIRRFGHDVTVLYENLDPKMPDHQADPSVPANMKALQQKVVEAKADIGIAFDGDADRIGVVDEKGQIIFGDKLLLLYAREILARKPGAIIIGDVKSSNPSMLATGIFNFSIKSGMCLKYATALIRTRPATLFFILFDIRETRLTIPPKEWPIITALSRSSSLINSVNIFA